VAEFVLHEGDIVIAMDRPFISEGFKVAALTADDLPALLLQRVGRFTMDDITHRPLVWAFVHSRSFQFQLLVQQEGTDLPHISKAQIEGAVMPRQSLQATLLQQAFSEASSAILAARRELQCARALRTRLVEVALS
jgi:hypothetical protein